MAKRGIIGIDRAIMHHPLFGNDALTKREAWIWIICEASYKAREKYVDGLMLELQRGQFSHSVRFMGEAWKWSKSKVDRFLKRLVFEGMIEISSRCPAESQLKMSWSKSGTPKGRVQSIITICNYDEFQNFNKYREAGNGTKLGQQRDSSGTNLTPDVTPDVTPDKSKSPKPAKKPSKKGTRISEDWFPDSQDIEFAFNKGYDHEQIKSIGESFKDYWLASTAKSATALDWRAKWRTWINKDIEFKGNPKSRGKAAKQTGNNGRSNSSITDAFEQVDKHRLQSEQ